MNLYRELRSRMDGQHGPLAVRLTNAFAAAVDEKVVGPGEALPPERELAAELGISRSTLRQCLRQLAASGRVTTRRGAGSVVASRISKPIARLTGFTEDMLSRGLTPSSRVLERAIVAVPPDTAFRTGLPLGTPTLILVRLRKVGDDVFAYERSIVPLRDVGEDYDGTGSLYARMDRFGARPKRILQSLKATEASNEIAGFLGIRPGSAVLEIRRVGYGAEGLAVEDAISWYRGDRYEYVGEING